MRGGGGGQTTDKHHMCGGGQALDRPRAQQKHMRCGATCVAEPGGRQRAKQTGTGSRDGLREAVGHPPCALSGLSASRTLSAVLPAAATACMKRPTERVPSHTQQVSVTPARTRRRTSDPIRPRPRMHARTNARTHTAQKTHASRTQAAGAHASGVCIRSARTHARTHGLGGAQQAERRNATNLSGGQHRPARTRQRLRRGPQRPCCRWQSNWPTARPACHTQTTPPPPRRGRYRRLPQPAPVPTGGDVS